MQDDSRYRERVYKIVRRIPSGRVMTYGQIAEILGDGYTARTVGFVMHASGDQTPWHRVINARGACSTGKVVLPKGWTSIEVERLWVRGSPMRLVAQQGRLAELCPA